MLSVVSPPSRADPPRPRPSLTLVVDEAFVLCLYCDDQLVFGDDLWCSECEEPSTAE